jgi:hypothetical protein
MQQRLGAFLERCGKNKEPDLINYYPEIGEKSDYYISKQSTIEQFWIKTGGLVGGVGLSSMLFTASVVVDINKNLGFFLAFLGFFLAGIGSSALAPIFFSIAGRLSNGKNAVAVAQLSFVNTFIIFVAKNILAWIVQISSIMIALVITSILMAALLYFGRVGSTERQ